MIWTYELKVKLVKAYLSKGKYLEVPGVDKHTVANRTRFFISIYQKHGLKGLHGGLPYKDIDKIKAVKEMLKGKTSYQVAIEMGMCTQSDCLKWFKIYKAKGFMALLNQHDVQNHHNKILKVEDDEVNYYSDNKDVLKELIRKNHLFKEENELLKKLLALTQLK